MISYIDGWYDEEHDGMRPFRWMGREASCRIAPLEAGGRSWLLLIAGHAFDGERSRLSVRAGDRMVGVRSIGQHASRYLFPLDFPRDARGHLDLTLTLDRTFSAAGDPRALGLMVHRFEVVDTSEARETLLGDGWYEWEDDDYFSGRWMAAEGQILVPGPVRRRGTFAALSAYTEVEDCSQTLTILHEGQTVAEFPLLPRWHVYPFTWADPLGRDDREPSESVVLRVNRLVPATMHPSDSRDLGVRVGTLEVHDDARRHARVRALHQFTAAAAADAVARTPGQPATDDQVRWPSADPFFEQNAALNEREFENGATILESFPTVLGIDTYGRCNIKPPCVYCQWDVGKDQEGGDVDTVVDDRTLREYGPFFHAARTFVNCSIGEPLLNPRLPQILDLIASHGKLFELSTNGQALTHATIRALAGRQIVLNVSLDAASDETYRRLRNDRWYDILSGLIALREARLRAGGLPRVHLVFMPMRANLHELEAFFQLCRVVRADTLVLLSLLRFEHTNITADRGGYHFDYARELLTRREIETIIERAAVLGRQYDVCVSSRFDPAEDSTTAP